MAKWLVKVKLEVEVDDLYGRSWPDKSPEEVLTRLSSHNWRDSGDLDVVISPVRPPVPTRAPRHPRRMLVCYTCARCDREFPAAKPPLLPPLCGSCQSASDRRTMCIRTLTAIVAIRAGK